MKFVSQNHKNATYTRLLTKQDGFIPLLSIKKALNNEKLTYDELPKIIKEYLLKNPKSKTLNSSKMICNYFRGLSPWPGIWTLININNQPKRLKIINMDLVDGKLMIKQVQLEGKREVDFNQFNSFYKIFK